MSDFDSPWKEALEFFFEDFIEFFFPQVHADIDWARGVEFLDKELQQLVPESEHGLRIVDKLARVFRLSGDEDWVLAHVEVQGQPEQNFEQRMYVYNFRVFDRFGRQVATLAVLCDNRAEWRPSEYRSELWGCEVRFRFPTVKLLDYAGDWAALEASPNPFAAVVMAHVKTKETAHDPEGRKFWKLHIIKNLYRRGWNKDQIFQLFRVIDWMMDLPAPLAYQFREEFDQFDFQENNMPYVTSIERIAKEEGVVTTLRKTIELALSVRGPGGQSLRDRVRELTDPHLLEQILNGLILGHSLEEIEQLLP